ncbi:potassium transporter Kup [Sphingorhabdus lutea]|uniref:Probable potassium transport system protein Kup n=1 Tax=Sphingorhabdus lutea TaxID=1913578 RepID=A0A1L3JCQ6_9SPHN|nr:potassium transporter Kup [Sphingorhabdus lutea]APG62921.1 potassium transporter Kup [Sphingorhabdus lutea]
MTSAQNTALVEGNGENTHHGGHKKASLGAMAVGAIGVVFGDIGTSPIYALRETFAGHHPLDLDVEHIYGVISLMFWSMILVVTVKYVAIVMRADNKGEGGSLALLALISKNAGKKSWTAGIVLLGIFATALFYGDSMITPAVSVLSAVEGVGVYSPALSNLILPLAIGILIFLFAIQRAGTSKVAAFFGPIMLLYFGTIAVLGIISIAATPSILYALMPHHAINFFIIDGYKAFLALGTVVLAVTGAEALYADMGHFGRKPIGVSWLVFVLPALILNYMGQGALLIRDGAPALESPFYLLAPEWFQLPLIIIATMAAIIASQAVITGAFSVTQQAIQLGFIPRLQIEHTSASQAGQIYIPTINWFLMTMVIILVLTFQSSSNLTAAYGIAVTGAMLIDSCLLAVLLTQLWKWKLYYSIPLLAIFFIVDIAYFGANLTKVPDGGWFPLLIGAIIAVLLTTWARGRMILRNRMADESMPLDIFIQSARSSAQRAPGTAIFMASSPDGVPSALLHNIKHNKVLHERVVILTVQILDIPHVRPKERALVTDLGDGFFRIVLRYGFMQESNVPLALKNINICGGKFDMMKTSFFLSRQTLRTTKKGGMAQWRKPLFSWMLRNAANAMDFFKLPTNRVVELGSQVEI